MSIANKVKDFFHNEGIHSTTIQPEFIEDPPESPDIDNCVLDCGNDRDCGAQRCCTDEVKLRKINPGSRKDKSKNGKKKIVSSSSEDGTETGSGSETFL